MKEKNVKVTLGEILYGLFFGSLFLAKGLGFYDGQTIFKLVLVFAVSCLFVKLGIERYTMGEYLRIAFVLLLTGITYLTSGEKGLLLCGLMMIGMKYVEVKRVFWLGTIIWSVSFLGITCTSLLHMEDTVFKVHDKLGLGHIFRWSLGYPHPNVLQVSYFILAILIIYVLGEKFRPRHAVWLFLGNLLTFLYSVSYTGFIIFMILLAERLYLYYRKKLYVLEKALLFVVYPVCALLSLLAPVKITGELFVILNKLLSTRMELGWRYLKPENYTLFGLKVAEITDASHTMDNSYLFAFIAYGIIPFALLSIGIMYAVYYFLKKDSYIEVLIMVAIVAGGLTEPFLFNTSFKNLGFVLGGTLLFGNKKQKREFALAAGWNKELYFPAGGLEELLSRLKELFSFDWKRCSAGAVFALLLCCAVQANTVYPAGYVLHREDCADITKEFKYYEENADSYEGYERMGSFSQGDEIEYFSGNIVKLEKVRDVVSSVTIGYAAGYLGMGVWCTLKKRKSNRAE